MDIFLSQSAYICYLKSMFCKRIGKYRPIASQFLLNRNHLNIHAKTCRVAHLLAIDVYKRQSFTLSYLATSSICCTLDAVELVPNGKSVTGQSIVALPFT